MNRQWLVVSLYRHSRHGIKTLKLTKSMKPKQMQLAKYQKAYIPDFNEANKQCLLNQWEALRKLRDIEDKIDIEDIKKLEFTKQEKAVQPPIATLADHI